MALVIKGLAGWGGAEPHTETSLRDEPTLLRTLRQRWIYAVRATANLETGVEEKICAACEPLLRFDNVGCQGQTQNPWHWQRMTHVVHSSSLSTVLQQTNFKMHKLAVRNEFIQGSHAAPKLKMSA